MDAIAKPHTFDAVHEFTALALISAGAQPVSVDELFARRELIRDSGNLVSTLDRYCLHDADVRMVRLVSNKVDVLNVFFYPAPQCLAPTYAMEFVQLGGKPVVAVMDVLAMTRSASLDFTLDEAVAAARGDFVEPNSDDAPEWYQACRSGRDIFVRPTSVESFAQLAQIHLNILSRLCPLHRAAQALPPHEATMQQEKIAAYKHHHHVNSPGLPIMNRMFGEAWTQQFMAEWVFA